MAEIKEKFGNNNGRNWQKYKERNEKYGDRNDKYGEGDDKYKERKDKYGDGNDKYEDGDDKYKERKDKYGDENDKYGKLDDKYYESPPSYGQPMCLSKDMPCDGKIPCCPPKLFCKRSDGLGELDNGVDYPHLLVFIRGITLNG